MSGRAVLDLICLAAIVVLLLWVVVQNFRGRNP